MTKVETVSQNQFVFKKHDCIGTAAAEEDVQFLDDCFVDTGELGFLLDCKSPKRIIVGRTGTGKSALIYQLKRAHKNVVQLSPHDLSLNFIATNKVIAFFEAAGVNLAPFYVLLWKHILVVELLKKKFNIVNEGAHKDFMGRMKSSLYKKDRYKEQALDYLEQWGNKFWLTTEERIHDLTDRVEKSLKGGIGSDLSGVTFSMEGARNLTTEQKTHVVEHGLDAVSKVQIRELDNMLELLEENVFDDSKDRHYIAVDMLDEDWADDRIKFKLIRALIDSVRRFKVLTNVKIVLALRQDLLDKVLSMEAVSGFQEEKYKSLYLGLSWDKKALIDLVEQRINQLIKRRYTKGDVTFQDVFVSSVDGESTLDYLLERTFYRPRDVIIFVNECLALADGRPSITASIIKEAEGRYSAERMQSLAHEWQTILPNLNCTIRLFYGMRERFELSELSEQFLQTWFNEVIPEIADLQVDPITKALSGLYMGDQGNFGSTRNFVIREFYVTGAIGIKSGPSDPVSWSRLNAHARLVPGEVRPSSTIVIHPMFHRVLGIRKLQSVSR